MRRNSECAGFTSENPSAKHAKSRCPRTTGALRDPLQGSGDRQHRGRDLDAAKGRIFGRDQKIASQRQLETAAECDPLHHRYCRYFQHFDGAIGNVYIRDKRSEPVDVLSWPFTHFAAEAKVRPLRPNDKHTYVAHAGLMHGYPQGFRETQIESVKGRV